MVYNSDYLSSFVECFSFCHFCHWPSNPIALRIDFVFFVKKCRCFYLQDLPQPDIAPHAEDPGTPELLSMILPKNSFCRKGVLAMHRNNKGVEPSIEPGQYLDWRRGIALGGLPKPQAKTQAKAKANANSAASSSSTTKSKVKSKTSSAKPMHTKDI